MVKCVFALTFSAKIRSPTSKVGDIELEGMDRGSAKVDLNNKLTVAAVNIALASSEQTLKTLENQLPVLSNSFPLIWKLTVVLLLLSLTFSTDFTVPVPPLSTSGLLDPRTASLHGSHLDPCKNGRIETALNGEIPQAPMLEQETPAVDFIRETNPTAIALPLQLSPKISPAIVLYIAAELL
jgi:hypothetical protein